MPSKRLSCSEACPKGQARRDGVGRGWAPAEADHSFKDATRSLPLRAWQPVIRCFRDGHTELTLFGYGPGQPVRAVCATTDRRALPDLFTWVT